MSEILPPESLVIGAVSPDAWPDTALDTETYNSGFAAYTPPAEHLRRAGLVHGRLNAIMSERVILPLSEKTDPLYAAQAGVLRIVRDRLTTGPDEFISELEPAVDPPHVFDEIVETMDRQAVYDGPDAYRVTASNRGQVSGFRRSVYYAVPDGQNLVAMGNTFLLRSGPPVTTVMPGVLTVDAPERYFRADRGIRVRTRIAGIALLVPVFKPEE